MQNDKNNVNKASNPWLIFLVTTLGVCMMGLDASIVNVALPTLTKHFHVGLSLVQWTVTSYLLAVCALLPLGGRLGDMYTKRRIYLLGLLLFTIGSLLCAVATTIMQLILFRALQGLGGAMGIANNQALIAMNFPKEKLGRALGVNTMTNALGLILGPSIGGVLLSAFGWPSIFLINIPLGLAAFIIGCKRLPRNEVIKKEQFDIVGTMLFIIGLILLLLTISNGVEWHWTGMTIALCVLVAVAILYLFVRWEMRTKSPVIDISIFKKADYSLGNIVAFLALMSVSVNSFALPFVLQDMFGFAPKIVGLYMFIPPIFMLFCAPISGYLSDFIEQKLLAAIGCGVLAIGMLIEVFINLDMNLWMLVFAQALTGIGFGTLMSPNNTILLKVTAPGKLGVASSINGLVRNMGKIFGTAFAVFAFLIMQQYASLFSYVSQSDIFFGGVRCALTMASVFAFVAMLLQISQMMSKRRLG